MIGPLGATGAGFGGVLAGQGGSKGPTDAYQASKAALNALTIALAKKLEDTRIKTNSICPGWVQTDLGGPDNRAAAPLSADKAARIIVEMASIPDDGPSGQFVDSTGTVPGSTSYGTGRYPTPDVRKAG